MGKPILMAGFALGAVLWLGGNMARAQPPYTPGADPRAYRHFLLSPSPHKVYSGYTPGVAEVTEGPFTRYTRSIGPGYLNQSISPRGFEEYRVVPGYEESFEGPFEGRYHYVPPDVRYRYLPPRPYGP